MFNKKHLKLNLDKEFEEYMSKNPNDVHKMQEEKKSINDWKEDDDDSSRSSSYQLGKGINFLKKPDSKSKTTAKEDLKLKLTDYSDNEEVSHTINDEFDRGYDENSGFLHPVTFEGITEQSGTKTKPLDSQKNFQKTDEAFVMNTGSLNTSKNEHFLSKVSLVDSQDYGSKYGKDTASDPFGIESEAKSLKADEINHQNNSFDLHKKAADINKEHDSHRLDGSSFSFNKSSMNPASGDSYNNTQGITNITDTVIGDTTAADLAGIHQRLQTIADGDNHDNGSKVTNHESGINSQYNRPSHQDNSHDYISNAADSETTNSFGLKAIHPEDTDRSSPTPTPRHKSVSKSDIAPTNLVHATYTKDKLLPHSKSNSSVVGNRGRIGSANQATTRKYSHIESSGYGIKSPNNKPTSATSHNKQNQLSSRGNSQSQAPQQKQKSQRKAKSPSVESKRRSVEFSNEVSYSEYDFSKPNNVIDDHSISLANEINDNSANNANQWKDKWIEERRLVKKLQADSTIQERDFRVQIKNMTIKYENQLSLLEKQVAQYKHKVIPDLQSKVPGDKVTREDLDRIQKELTEQETIITAYQKDNERLCKEIKELKSHNQFEMKVDNAETERHLSQIASLKSDLESNEIEIMNLRKMNKQLRDNKDFSNSHFNLHELCQEEISQMKSELKNLTRINLELDRDKQFLEKKMDKLITESDKLSHQYHDEFHIQHVEMDKLKESHQIEVLELKKKIKWYLENQALLDKDNKKLKQKDVEIADLKKRLESADNIRISSNIRVKEKQNDTNRIKKLEEDNMSLKEDMYALIKEKNLGHILEKRSVQFLEEKIKSLEKENQENVDKENLSLRQFQQQFESLKAQYEEKIRDLELDMIKIPDRTTRIEKEDRINELKNKIEALNKQILHKNAIINKLKKELAEKVQQKADSSPKKSNLRRVDIHANKVDNLMKQLQDKEIEIQRLQIQNSYLLSTDKQIYHPQRTFVQPNIELEAEATTLKSQIAHNQFELDKFKQLLENERLEFQLREQRIHEEYNLKIQQIETFHRDNLRNVKIDFVARHSESDVTALKSQNDLQKSFIDNLQNQLKEYKQKQEDFTVKSHQFEAAQHRIQDLETELRDLRVVWTNNPSLEIIDRLRSKIVTLEEKENTKSRYIDEYADKIVKLKCQKFEEEIAQLKTIIYQKNQSLIKVQKELNQLLETLEELRIQGVTLPSSRLK